MHPASGIRQAIFRNILLAIGCQPEEDRQGHECDLERVHLFFALSDDPVHSPASCSGQSCGADNKVEDFMAFFPEHFVKGSYVQDIKHPYTREVYIFAPRTSHTTPHTSHTTPHTSHTTPHICHLTSHTQHLTPHTQHLIPCTQLQPACPVEWAHSRRNIPQVCHA